MNDNGIEYDDNEIEDNDDKIEENDEDHEENETQRGGAGFVKKKHGNTIDHHETGIAIPTATDVLPTTTPEEEEVEVRRGKTAEDDEERETKTVRGVAIAKQRFKDRLAAASRGFDFNLLKPAKATNDNFRPVVSWPLMDQLTRRTFEPNEKRRTKSIAAARYVRNLIDLVEADQTGLSVYLPGKDAPTDYDVQRTGSGKVVFDHGQTLDRRKVTYDSKNDEEDAERYSGSMRTAKNSVQVNNGGYDPNRDDPFPVRVMAAREELDFIIAAVGPVLWPSLKAALSENATMTDIGLALGVKRYQAPSEGVAIIRRALTAAMEMLHEINEKRGEPRRPTPLPDKSRISRDDRFLNLAGGPVIKVAA
jgi:hypothetical protein